jgi:hypothetical protein
MAYNVAAPQLDGVILLDLKKGLSRLHPPDQDTRL